MDFPIVDVLSDELATEWLLRHFHPDGLICPRCSKNNARQFRRTAMSDLTVYRCNHCQRIYNLYSGTLFSRKHLRPAQALLLLQRVCQGKSSVKIAREIGVTRQTVLSIRRAIQTNAEALQINLKCIKPSFISKLVAPTYVEGKTTQPQALQGIIDNSTTVVDVR